MSVIIKRNLKLKDQADIQNDLIKIQRRRRKGEDQEDEVYSYGCII